MAVAAHSNPEVLLVDEALAVGDLSFNIKCVNRIADLRRRGTAVLFVSHNEFQVRLAASKCLLLNDGHAEEFADVDKAYIAYDRILAASREDNVQCANNESDTGVLNAVVSIQSVTLIGPDGLSRACSGDRVHFLLRCEAEQKLIGTELEIRIWSDEGHLVSTLKSSSCARYLDLPIGDCEISVAIESIPLRPGRYRLAGGFNKQGEVLYWGRNLATIEIEPPHDRAVDAGIISLPAAFGDPQTLR
jgi:energy-coupling factor transporter ATP-binding protein EcfA2